MPIVQNVRACEGYPFEAIDPRVLARLRERAAHFPDSLKTCGSALALLECFLEITGRTLTLHQSRAGLRDLSELFIGALHSPKFMTSKTKRIYDLSCFFLRAVRDELGDDQTDALQTVLHTVRNSADARRLAERFEELSLLHAKVIIWGGWPCTNSNGDMHWLPLRPVFERLGEDFTSRLHAVCKAYTEGRRSSPIPCISTLSQFIGSYPDELTSADFERSAFVEVFFGKFLAFHFKSRYADGEGAQISSLVTEWRTQFIPFAKNHLIRSGLFAEPFGDIPTPPVKNVKGARTNLRQTREGVLIKATLLTDVPLHISDSEAKEILFKQVQLDFDRVVAWARHECDDIWNRHQNRTALALNGATDAPKGDGGKIWLIDRRNPKWRENAAAIFEARGFLTSHEARLAEAFPSPLSETAHVLGLPVTDALLPHAALLVAEHPEITTSFLQSLKLFDKNGKRTGLVDTDAGSYLVGEKPRRGPQLAEQKILLSDVALNIVHQIIALTTPLREWLRQRNSNHWRYLFLTCGNAFAQPMRVNNFAMIMSVESRRARISEQIRSALNLTADESLSLASRFSLKRLRSSAGALVFLKTGSVEKMAKALGHTRYDSRLIERYLPRPILEFFQERWVRLFQTSVIIEAMKDSPLILEASAFQSIEQVDAFLEHHAIRKIPLHIEDPDAEQPIDLPSQQSHEIAIGVNAGILTVLLSLQQAVEAATRPVTGRAMYWSAFTQKLVAYLDATYDRPDLKHFLREARAHANPARLSDVIHES